MTDLDAFRNDFRFVFQWWKKTGEKHGTDREYKEAASAVQKNMHDAEWMKCASDHFRNLVERIKADCARSERIASEVRADKEQARKKK